MAIKDQDTRRLIADIKRISIENERLKESQWVVYFNSVPDKTTDNLEKITAGPFNPVETRGFIIASWSWIFSAFQSRDRFIDINRKIQYNFGDYAAVSRPFPLLKPYAENTRQIILSTIASESLIPEDEGSDRPANEKFFPFWLSKIIMNSFEALENRLPPGKRTVQPGKDLLIKKIADFSRYFSRYFRRYFIRDFSQYFIRYIIRDFIRYFSRYVIRDFIRDLSRDLIRDLSRDFSRNFSRVLSRDFSPDFKDVISNFYQKKYNEKLNWDKLSGDNYEKLYLLYLDEFEKENWQFIDEFFNYLHRLIFDKKFEITFEYFDTVQFLPRKQANVDMPASLFISIKNSLMIPFTFDFILTGAVHYYFLNIMADLNIIFHNKEEISDSSLLKAIDNFMRKNPFDLYFINLSWDFYARAFNETYQKLEENESKPLALAAFVVNAAKVSMAAGLTPEGDHWDKTLVEAEKSGDLFVRLSLTLYKLCTFQDSKLNSQRLKSQLESFKTNYPAFYRLIGFKDEKERKN